MENGQSTAAKLGLPPLTPEQQEALQKVSILDMNLHLSILFWLVVCVFFLKFTFFPDIILKKKKAHLSRLHMG